jgi:hypothetical protein
MPLVHSAVNGYLDLVIYWLEITYPICHSQDSSLNISLCFLDTYAGDRSQHQVNYLDNTQRLSTNP